MASKSNKTASTLYAAPKKRFFKLIKSKCPDCQFNDFLTDFDHFETIWKHIEDSNFTDSSKKTYLVALKQLALEQGVSYDSYLLPRIQDLRDKINTNEAKNKLDEKEDNHWMPWEKILEIMEFLENVYKLCPSYKLAQQRLLLGMYIYHPPLRLNYGTVYLFPEKKLADNMDYLYSLGDKWICHIGHDKVSNRLGSFEFVLHPKIKTWIEELARFGPRLFLITMLDDYTKPIVAEVDRVKEMDNHKRYFQRFLYEIPSPWGVSCLCTFTLRSAWVTKFMQRVRTAEELQKMASAMRTSVDQFYSYYLKVYDSEGKLIYKDIK